MLPYQLHHIFTFFKCIFRQNKYWDFLSHKILQKNRFFFAQVSKKTKSPQPPTPTPTPAPTPPSTPNLNPNKIIKKNIKIFFFQLIYQFIQRKLHYNYNAQFLTLYFVILVFQMKQNHKNINISSLKNIPLTFFKI